jgi:hypothetical protein
LYLLEAMSLRCQNTEGWGNGWNWPGQNKFMRSKGRSSAAVARSTVVDTGVNGEKKGRTSGQRNHKSGQPRRLALVCIPCKWSCSSTSQDSPPCNGRRSSGESCPQPEENCGQDFCRTFLGERISRRRQHSRPRPPPTLPSDRRILVQARRSVLAPSARTLGAGCWRATTLARVPDSEPPRRCLSASFALSRATAVPSCLR